METRWTHTTSENFDKLIEESKGVCVIPMGCLEKHGLHLPVGTDIIQASTISYMASQLETFCVFPDFTFGNQGSPQNPPKGTIALTGDLMYRTLVELCKNISRNGFKKIVVYNGHGGNLGLLSHFSSHISDDLPADFVFCNFHIDALVVPDKMAKILNKKGSGAIPELTKEDEDYILDFYNTKKINGHAGICETAFIMGSDPESVHLDRLGIESGLPTGKSGKYAGSGLGMYGQWGMDVPNWFEGHDPVGVNERIGKAALRLEAERLAKGIKLLKEDDYLYEFQVGRR